jgi:hypothetical protein
MPRKSYWGLKLGLCGQCKSWQGFKTKPRHADMLRKSLKWLKSGPQHAKEVILGFKLGLSGQCKSWHALKLTLRILGKYQ